VDPVPRYSLAYRASSSFRIRTSTAALVVIESPSCSRSTHDDRHTPAAGIGSFASLTATSVATARPPPAESPATVAAQARVLQMRRIVKACPRIDGSNRADRTKNRGDHLGVRSPPRQPRMVASGRVETGPDERGSRPVAGLRYERTPSITLTRAIVGMILVSRKPAASNSARNSASERWRPPVFTSILTSFAAAPRLSRDWSIRFG
jgi:hypothetical protein